MVYLNHLFRSAHYENTHSDNLCRRSPTSRCATEQVGGGCLLRRERSSIGKSNHPKWEMPVRLRPLAFSTFTASFIPLSGSANFGSGIGDAKPTYSAGAPTPRHHVDQHRFPITCQRVPNVPALQARNRVADSRWISHLQFFASVMQVMGSRAGCVAGKAPTGDQSAKGRGTRRAQEQP